MGRKTTMEKGKGKQSDVQYDKCHRMRCSPSELAKTYTVLSNEKKALLHEMGFGALAENVSNYNFSNLIMMELVDSFHIPDSTIRTNIGRFKVDATKVGHALGLNATGGLYRQKMLKKEVPPEQYKAADKYRKKSLADLRDMVTQIQLDTEEGITSFKRAFILYVQKAVLCPNNSKPLSPKTLPTILDVTNPRAMNWGRHVYSFLLNGITEMKKKNLKSANGYVFALLIIYFQETHFGVDSEEADAQPPWLVYWKNSILKRRIKYEFEDPAGLAHQARSRTPTRPQKIIKTMIKIPPTKKEIMKSTLVKSLQIEGPPLHVGIIERRTKKRHEAINAAPLQPPQQGEADANPDATIDALADPSTQVNVNQEDHTKDADSASIMTVEEDDAQHDAVIVDATIATAPPKDTIPAAEEEVTPIFDASITEPSRITATGVESAEEENTHHNAMLVDAAIEMAPPKNIVPASEKEDPSIAEPSRVIEEAALTNLIERITVEDDATSVKNLEESVTRPEEEASEQELTLRDLPEIQKA
ncbi:hypothetical protein PIB30_101754 [Stylosanthes scabra]|uniref:DUF1985 domain-containing protein n=1 Tax=Stylosanthes scabra TaxID=79078 RepID=A0ABU6WXF0_9FABA|nr:hypothetical protein [Stylosanthes scabra]